MWAEGVGFDLFAFAGKRARAVSADTEISFQDFGRMHIYRRKVRQQRRLPTPTWTVNDDQLLEVVVSYIERRLYLHKSPWTKPMPERIKAILCAAKSYASSKEQVLNKLVELNRAGFCPDREVQNLDSQITLERRNPVAVMASLAYTYYRLGWNSVQVARELGMLSPAVRIALWRMNHTAKWIEAGRPMRKPREPRECKPREPRESTPRNHKWTEEREQEFMRLRKEGKKTFEELGRMFEISPSTAKSFCYYPPSKRAADHKAWHKRKRAARMAARVEV